MNIGIRLRQWFRNSLGKRLFMISLMSVIAVVALAETFAFPAYVDNLVMTKRKALEMSVRQSRDQLDYFLGSFVDISTKLNKDLRLRECLAKIVEHDRAGQMVARDAALREAQQLVQNEFDTLNHVWGIRLFRWNEKGNYKGDFGGVQSLSMKDPTLLITDNDSYQVVVDQAAETFLRRVADADGSVVWDPAVTGGRLKDLLSRQDHNQSYLLGKLLVNKVDPEAQYMVTLEFDPLTFGDFLVEFDLESDQHVRLVDTNDQIILYDLDPKFIGQHVGSAQPPSPPWMKEMGKPGQRKLSVEQKMKEARGGFMPVGPERFPKEVLIYAPLTVAPWQVMITLNLNALNEEAWASLWLLNGVLVGPAILIAFLIAWYTKRAVAQPIVRLGKVLNAVGDPDVMLEMIPVKGNDELAGLAESSNRVADLVRRVNAISAQIRQLLDYSGQGFLSFRADLQIEPAYSQACEWMLGEQYLEGKKVTSLLFRAEADIMHEMLGSVFRAGTNAEREMYLSLFPTELQRAARVYEVSYKIISRGADDALMVVMTDVTMQRRLMEKIEAESKMLQMIVKVVQQKADFFYTLDEWNQFVSEGCRALVRPDANADQDGDWMDIFDQLYRTIHTFKGSFGQFGLLKAAAKLHGLETQLSEAAESWETMDQLQVHVDGWALEHVIQAELDMLGDVLGEAFFTRNTGTVIDMERIRAFERRIAELLTEQQADLVRDELRRLNHQSFKTLLDGYARFVAELAEGLEKFVRPLQIVGDDVMVDPDHFRGWSQSLVHLFRNMLDHGLEGPDDRLEAGKDEFGSITCHVEREANHLVLTIADDGRGIDLARVKAKAIEKGLIDPTTADQLDATAIIDFIFADSFSTKESVSELSGRGVGMSAVKAETEALGGSLVVHSESGHGTTMIFRIPLAL